MFFTYIIECSDKTLYTGKTTDLEKRIRQHNGEIAGGAKYTKARRPVKLRYYEEFPTITEALQREHTIKQLTRQAKQHLIKSSTSTTSSTGMKPNY